MILSMLLLAAIASYAGASETEETIIMQKGGNYTTFVLKHYRNDLKIVYRAPIGLNNSDLKNLGIPEDAWPFIKADGDQIFSLNHYYDTKKIEALNQELFEKKETIRQQYLWLGIIIFGFGIMLPFTVTGIITKFNLWNQRRKVRPYLTTLKMIFGQGSH